MRGYVHSINSLSAVDGRGIRSVIFMQGCGLTCPYCHNKDACAVGAGIEYEAVELYNKLRRYYPYIRNGGITFSGGEPLMQSEFLTELCTLLKRDNINIALDTSGAILSEKAKLLIAGVDTVILDIKAVTEQDYQQHFGMKLSSVINFLQYCDSLNKEIWIRQVIVEGWNDNPENIQKLRQLISPYKNITKVELLPFKKLCIYKWDNLGLQFPMRDYAETSQETIKKLTQILYECENL